MGVLEQAKALQATSRIGPACRVCVFLDGRDDRDEWEALLADPLFATVTVKRLAEQYGVSLASSTWGRHRRGECKGAE